MAFKNKEITNPKTGQVINFLQTTEDTNGAFLEMESTYPSSSKEPPEHYHPAQDEYFTVMEGELTIKINGVEETLKAGHTIHIHPNTIHAMWNNSEHKTIVHWIVKPAFNTEYFLETLVALARDNKTDENGRPSLLQIAVLMNTFSNVFRLAKPTYLIQKVVFTALLPFSYLLGFKNPMKKHPRR